MKHIDRIIKYTHLSELDIEKIKYNRTMILCANLVEYITSEIIPLLGMDYNTKTITDDLCRVYAFHFEKVLIPNLNKLQIVNTDRVPYNKSNIATYIDTPQQSAKLFRLYLLTISNLNNKYYGFTKVHNDHRYLLRLYVEKDFQINNDNKLYWNDMVTYKFNRYDC